MAARSHTIKFYGGFEGKYKQALVKPPSTPGAGPTYWRTGDVWFDIFALGCRIRGYPTGWQVGLDRTYNVTISMPTGGTNGSDSLTLHFTEPPSGSSDAQTIDFTGGGWEIIGVAEEVITDTGGSDFPTYGGVKVADGPKEVNQVRSERLKPGTTLTVNVNAGGLSATGALAITEDNTFAVSYLLSMVIETQSWGDEAGLSSTAYYDWDGGEFTLNSPFSASTSQGHLASAPCVAYAPAEGYRTICTSVLAPPKKWAFYPRIRAMEQAYPTSVAFAVDKNRLDLAAEVIADGTGALAASGSQRHYSTGASFWQAGMQFDTIAAPGSRNWTQTGITQPTSSTLDEWGRPFRCWIRNQWLVEKSENQRDWRTMLLETPFPAYSLQHLSSYTAESGAGVWTNGANVTPSNSGGYVVLAVAGGEGSASLTFALTGRENTINPGDDWQAFRYLEIELQADASSKPFTLSVMGKTWSSTTHGTANTDIVRTFDLSAPHNAATPSDATDSRWPLNVSPGDYFGLVKALTMTLSDLEDGVTYRVNRITLVRSTRAKVTHALALERWAPNSVGSDYNRHVTGEVDGEVGAEVAGMTRTPLGNDYTYTYPSIAQCVDAINERPGWMASLAGSYPDDTHDEGTPLMYCGGKDGGYYDGGWHDSFDQDATAGLDITACKQYDSIDIYPACGDIQSLTYGEETPMRVYKAAFQGEVWGLVIDNTTHAGNSGENVDITGAPSADETVVTDSLGHYRSGPRKQATVSVSTGGTSLSQLLHARYRRFGGFGGVGSVESDGLSADFTRGQRFVRAYRLDGTIRLAFADDATWTNFTERDTGLSGKPTEVRWERAGRQNLLYLCYIDANNALWLLSSANEGGRWGMATTLASGVTQNALCVGGNSLSYAYWRTSGGAIYGKIVDAFGNLVHPLDDPTDGFEVIASGVDDADIACACTPGGEGSFQVVLDYYVGGALTQIRSVDGVAFS